MHIEYDKNRPIYLQIIEKIKSKIISGEINPGDKLPAILDMAVEMDVNQNTICRVYKALENEDLIETRRGLGSYVKDNDNLVKNLSEEMADKIIDPAISRLRNLDFSDDEIVTAVKDRLKK